MRQLVYGLAHSLCLAMLMVPQMALAQTVEDDRVDADDEDDDRVDVEDDDRVDAEEGDDAFSVTVEAERPRVTASERRIDREMLEVTPRTTAEDLLRLVPGLVLVQHGNEGKGHQLYLRGFDAVHGSDVEVTLEGIPLNEMSNVHGQGYLDLAFIIPELVDSLDVTKGAYRLEQGNFATAGSVRFNLGVPRYDRGVGLRYEVGTTRRHRLLAMVSPPSDGSTFLALEAMRDAGFGDNRQTERLSAMGQALLWRGAQGLQVTALGTGYLSTFGLPGLLRYEDVRSGERGLYDSYITTEGGFSGRAIASVEAQGHVGHGRATARGYGMWRRLSLDENFTGFLRYPEQGDRRGQHQEAWSAGLRTHTTQRLAPTFGLEALATWHTDRIEQQERQLDPNGSSWQTNRNLTIVQHTGAVGGGVQWLPLTWLVLEGGVRLDLLHFDVD
ncbi:MAG: TonB-dependent receptor plug domain-containing protein, partial [Myxococcota bacterium]